MTDVSGPRQHRPSGTADQLWWMHPTLRGRPASDLPAPRARQAPDPHDIPGLPRGSYRWVNSEDPLAQFGSHDHGAMPEGHGGYQDLAKILFKHNGYRPGPVRGWFVVVSLAAGHGWAVAQLCANAFTPVQLFEDMIYSAEEDAFARAKSLRSNNPGAIRRDFGSGGFALLLQSRGAEQTGRHRGDAEKADANAQDWNS